MSINTIADCIKVLAKVDLFPSLDDLMSEVDEHGRRYISYLDSSLQLNGTSEEIDLVMELEDFVDYHAYDDLGNVSVTFTRALDKAGYKFLLIDDDRHKHAIQCNNYCIAVANF